MYINWEPFQPMLWLAVPSDYKYFSVSPFKLIGFSLFFFFINYNLMNICGIMVPSYTLPDVSFRQTANPQRIAARWLSLSLAVLIFILIIYQDYSDLKNNFLFFFGDHSYSKDAQNNAVEIRVCWFFALSSDGICSHSHLLESSIFKDILSQLNSKVPQD